MLKLSDIVCVLFPAEGMAKMIGSPVTDKSNVIFLAPRQKLEHCSLQVRKFDCLRLNKLRRLVKLIFSVLLLTGMDVVSVLQEPGWI